MIAVAFMLGELWGHLGHGVPWLHVLQSWAIDAAIFGMWAHAAKQRENALREEFARHWNLWYGR